MAKPTIRVGVNGYGVIGKRVADAVSLQDDMQLVGVSDVAADYRVKTAAKRGYQIYCSAADKIDAMKQGGIPVVGMLEDMLKQVDVIVDCTPAGIGAKNKVLYDKLGLKSIFQGGEKHDVIGASFVAQCDYEENLNKQSTRVVSCNTTGICRTLGAIHKNFGIKKARVVLFRRATDPWESHKTGVINTVIPEAKVPSHQGPDAQTVIHDLNIVTIAAKGPYNLSHLHFAMVEPSRQLTQEEVLGALQKEPRLALIRASDGLDALNAVIELMRDIGRMRADMWEVAVWEDILAVKDEIYLVYQVHNESIVVPENIDAIRALTGTETDWRISVEKTDKSLGIVKRFL